ncbi:MAG: HTTM domain-containing protein [Pirellulales bacterium]|nr:HTTM domain-containing protein [Pirellulales bacterium]
MKNSPVAHPALGSISSLFRIDIRTLALFRVLISAIVLIDLGIRFGDLQTMYSDQGVIPVELIKNHFSFTWRWSVFWIDGSIYFQATLFVLTALFVIALLIGFYTRIATIGSWILLTSLYNRVPYAVSGADTLLIILFFWAMFLPLGCCWSVDAWRGKPTTSTEKTLFSGATIAILIQVFLLYFCTGCYKAIYHSQPGMLLQNTLEWADYNRPVGDWLLSFPTLLKIFSWTSIGFELLAPWLLFSPWKTSKVRLWTLFGLVALHIGIELTLSVALFSYVAAAGFSLFLPSAFWDARCWEPVRSFCISYGIKSKYAGHLALQHKKTSISSIALNSLSIMLILYVMLLSAYGFFERSKIIVKPTFMHRVNELTMLNQRWSMFASLQRRQTRLIAHARLENGKEIDLLRVENHSGGSPAPVEQPNHRWVKYFQALSRASTPQVFKDCYARWLFENWNDSHSQEEQIQQLSLRRLRQMLPDEENLSHVGTETLAVVRNENTLIEETIQWNSPWRNP